MLQTNLKINSYGKTNRAVINSLLSFNLPGLFEKVKLKQTWMKGELYSKILMNRPYKQIVLTTTHEDTEIDSFQSDDSVTFQVISGKLKLHTRKESIVLNQGQLFTLNEKINYSLTTTEETLFLLTIVKASP